MPRKAKYPELAAHAEALATNFAKKDQEHFKASYLANMSTLNARVDRRCAVLGADLAALALAYGNPGVTAVVQTAAAKAVREMANSFLTALAPFANPPVRALVVKAVLATLKDTNTAIVKHQADLMERQGVRAD